MEFEYYKNNTIRDSFEEVHAWQTSERNTVDGLLNHHS
ncbi:hypothetical protein CLV98_11839 [Dyadobacter jejuensis]|uniref:Uncharacterized protein n=1 Tax=Dyadobacter jejuensis TaxID=1082580 RepID=A0A316AVX5_9BACT|nr:hypothetical protein CLV98_11839 [Dyadobacter jejuensis]